MQIDFAKDILEKASFDGYFGEALDTSIKLMEAVQKLRYSDKETIEMLELDRILKEVERPEEDNEN